MRVPDHVYTLGNRDLEIACEAVLEGASIIKHGWDNQPAIFEEKGGHYDLVSEIDEQADYAIQKVLKNAFPNDPILSEELNPEWNDNIATGRLWICDPLDGTACFLFRTDPLSPAVMIALTDNGVPTVSVIMQPIIGHWTYAIKGQGAFRDGKRLCMQSQSGSGLKQAWVDLNQYGDKDFESEWFKRIDSFVRSQNGARLVSRSPPHSAIALRLLRPIEETSASAERGLEACVHDHNPEKPKQLPWDILPVQLIIQEAGGEYIDTCKGLETKIDPFNLVGPILIGNRSTIKYILDHA